MTTLTYLGYLIELDCEDLAVYTPAGELLLANNARIELTTVRRLIREHRAG